MVSDSKMLQLIKEFLQILRDSPEIKAITGYDRAQCVIVGGAAVRCYFRKRSVEVCRVVGYRFCPWLLQRPGWSIAIGQFRPCDLPSRICTETQESIVQSAVFWNAATPVRLAYDIWLHSNWHPTNRWCEFQAESILPFCNPRLSWCNWSYMVLIIWSLEHFFILYSSRRFRKICNCSAI